MFDNKRNNHSFSLLNLNKTKQAGEFCFYLNEVRRQNDKHVFQFASTAPKEGTTTIVLNIAHLLATTEKACRILLIDANFCNPQITSTFNLSSSEGLREALSHERSVNEPFNSTSIENLWVMSIGRSNTSQLLPDICVESLTKITQSLKDRFDYVLIDSAPLMATSNALAFALASDETILVVQSGRNDVKVIQKAVSVLNERQCSLNVAVLNSFSQIIPRWLYRWL